MSDDPYVYLGTRVLRNKLNIHDAPELDVAERVLSTKRARHGVPTGHFDLKHLRAIHRHLFQDIYDWAGEIRSVEIAKEGHQFMFRQYIENGMADVHRRVVAAKYLSNSTPDEFAREAGVVMGDVNYVHPFREGNGRTQMLYLQQLAARAGHRVNLRAFNRAEWMAASRHAHKADYAPIAAAIRAALIPV